MKNYIIIIVLTTLLFSCKKFNYNKNDDLKFICDKPPILLNISVIDSLSRNENKLSDFKVNDSVGLYKVLKKAFNFYDIYYYSKINKNTYVMFYSYDYSKAFFLLSLIDNKVKDFYELAYISGDGEDFDFKKSVYRNGVFYSSFVGGERTFTSPNDTIRYRFRGTSKISISKDGNITEDTLRIERNFFEIKPNEYSIESKY
ncbi:hypothetical protein RF683_02830 [Flavobacterium sp. 20NA77.7]|uniref:Lipoprotein n=1 Tax=Flavobacterium nakdongensis TaxID=3073563 RepID=A0ABY9RAX6_9FLAO|nr:hypothetical protein [Flavobacterium sp. 20NA77.7]WMW78397.1 hypothetical protein RF683_02830 [Flavobacterium sp. 20NA77.7]